MNSQMSPAQSSGGAAPISVSNTVALIGLILIGFAIGLCALMFGMTNQLPDGVDDFSQLDSSSPVHLRLLILGCSTAVLTVVALILCTVGMLLPNRPRGSAVAGLVLSLTVLLGVFGVLFVGVAMSPGVQPEPVVNPEGSATETATDSERAETL